MKYKLIYIKYFLLSLIIFNSVSCLEELNTDFYKELDPNSSNYVVKPVLDFKLAKITETSVELSWKNYGPGPKGHIIEKKTDAGEFIEIANVSNESDYYIDNFTVEVGTNYIYRIKSYATKTTVYSILVSAKFEFILPDFIITGISEDRALIKWNKQYFGIVGIQYKEKSEVEFQNLAEVSLPDTSFVINNLDINKYYDFRIYIKGERYTSGFSERKSIVWGFFTNTDVYFTNSTNARGVMVSKFGNRFAAVSPFVSYNNSTLLTATTINALNGKFFIDNNTILLSGFPNSFSNFMKFVNVSSGQIVDTLNYTATSFSLSDDYSSIFIASYPSGTNKDYIAKISYPDKSILWIKENVKVKNVNFISSKNILVCTIDNGLNDYISVFNGTDGSFLYSIEVNGYKIPTLNVHPNGNELLLIVSQLPGYNEGGNLQIWDLENRTIKYNLTTDFINRIYTAEYSLDGRYVLLSNSTSLWIYDMNLEFFDTEPIVAGFFSGDGFNDAKLSYDLKYIIAAQFEEKLQIKYMSRAWITSKVMLN